MPAQAVDNSEPSDWEYPAVAPTLYKEIREAIPAYDAKTSNVHYMGSVVENFRLRDGVITSSHPTFFLLCMGVDMLDCYAITNQHISH